MNVPVLDQIARLTLVPVLEIPDPAVAAPLADALAAGGLPCAEITFRTPAAAAAIEAMVKRRPDLLVGAGTVLTVAQVDRAVGLGARFVVSPGFDRAVVERCLERSVAALPGILTPSELQMALGSGLAMAKLFPAEAAGGPAYLRALSAPFPGFRFVPSGGITPHNLEGYLELPQVAAVGGSWMAPRDLLAAVDFAGVEGRVAEAVALVRRLRPPPPTSAVPT
jgi:2-dehydro-3-deoxyphosphogluconate aldolase / (4S)-4-hydroxy-2-oxoglutarate aldolase